MANRYKKTEALGSHRGDPTRAAFRIALSDVTAELARTANRAFPSDPLRRSALLVEEAAEAMMEALEDVRVAEGDKLLYQRKQYHETVQAASVALRTLTVMVIEGRRAQ